VLCRKRHIVVDTQGTLLRVAVHPANIRDREGAPLVLNKLRQGFERLRLLWADHGYQGWLVTWLMLTFGITLQIVTPPRNLHTFKLLPRRWVVERTFAWLGRFRRLSKDYEQLPALSEAFIYIASIRRLVRLVALS